MNRPQATASNHQKMRIAGKQVDGETGKSIEVLNPYTNQVVGTVPRASREQVAEAFAVAAAYKPVLSRYERQLRTSSARAPKARRNP